MHHCVDKVDSIFGLLLMNRIWQCLDPLHFPSENAPYHSDKISKS